MEKWPNLFIVGAPKAGTSSLYVYLKNIKGIYMSPVKEPNFFSITVFSEKSSEKPIRNKKKYLSLFTKAKEEMIIGEASPEYLSDIEAPKLIHEVSPNAKIIISIRDPIERAFSYYLMFVRRGRIKSSFLTLLQDSMEKKKIGLKSQYGLLETGLYYEQVERYLKIFGTNNVKIIIFEEFIKDPKKMIGEILIFLNLETSLDDFKGEVYNQYGVYRGKISQFILTNRTIGKIVERLISPSKRKILKESILIKNELKPEIQFKERKLLFDFYLEDVKKIQKLIGEKLPWKNFQNLL